MSMFSALAGIAGSGAGAQAAGPSGATNGTTIVAVNPGVTGLSDLLGFLNAGPTVNGGGNYGGSVSPATAFFNSQNSANAGANLSVSASGGFGVTGIVIAGAVLLGVFLYMRK